MVTLTGWIKLIVTDTQYYCRRRMYRTTVTAAARKPAVKLAVLLKKKIYPKKSNSRSFPRRTYRGVRASRRREKSTDRALSVTRGD